MSTSTMRENMAAWVEKLRAAGLCCRCGKKPPKKGHDLCASCMKKARKRRRRLWKERVAAGVCPACGGPRSDDNFIICRRCRDLQVVSKNKMLTKEKVNHYNMKWKSKLRREGRCSKCGGPKDTDLNWCSKCQAKAREHYRENSEEILAYHRRSYRLRFRPKELCPVCGTHYRRCPRCGTYMRVVHQNGQGACSFTCKCGIRIQVFR